MASLEETVARNISEHMDWIWDIVCRARDEQATPFDMQKAQRYKRQLCSLLELYEDRGFTQLPHSTLWLAQQICQAADDFADTSNKFYV